MEKAPTADQIPSELIEKASAKSGIDVSTIQDTVDLSLLCGNPIESSLAWLKELSEVEKSIPDILTSAQERN
jgi:hypothetical protein